MHQPDQAVLRCGVVRTNDTADIRRRGRDQDQPAPLAAPHRGQTRRLNPESRARICTDRFVEQGESDFFGPSTKRDAGVVAQIPISPSRFAIVAIIDWTSVRHRDVSPNRDRTMPALGDRFDDFIGGRSVFFVFHGDISAGPDKRDRASKPATFRQSPKRLFT
jgi:hypothetical protein